MKEETTGRLEDVLKNVSSRDEAEKFAESHGRDYGHFFEYLNDYIAETRGVVNDIVRRSGISRNYVYNILNGVTKNPGRDKIIAICIAAGMDLNHLNRGLKISGHNSLYPKNTRDIYIASCVNRGMNDVTKINLELEAQGQSILDV